MFEEARSDPAASPADTSAPDQEKSGPIERLMFAALPLWLVIVLGAVGLLGACALLVASHSAASGGTRWGALGRFANAIARAPSDLRTYRDKPPNDWLKTKEAVASLPDGFGRVEGSFKENGYLLLSRTDIEKHVPQVLLVRLSDKKILRTYYPDVPAINARSKLALPFVNLAVDRIPERYLAVHPLLMPDGGILFQDMSPLVRLDACSRIRWTVDGVFHHALEPGRDGTFWVPYKYTGSRVPDTSPKFHNDAISHVRLDGTIISVTPIADIFERSGMGHLWRSRTYTDDPFHLNDIQPVEQTGKYWQKGDLFLSMRGLSMIALYRPSTGKIIWWRDHPWRGQHDVQILDDHRISVFDNRVMSQYQDPATNAGRLDPQSDVVVYDFATDTASSPFQAVMKQENIGTWFGGMATPLPNGDVLIEESPRGRLIRISPDAVRWQYIAADRSEQRYFLGQSRYLDEEKYGVAVRAAVEAKCN